MQRPNLTLSEFFCFNVFVQRLRSKPWTYKSKFIFVCFSVYLSRIRTTLEFAAPVFNSGLTGKQIKQIEIVQKKACTIILARNYEKYEQALSILGLERLDTRRSTLCLNFALKCSKSKKHMSIFQQPSPIPHKTLEQEL